MNVRSESPINANFSVQSGDILNFVESEKIYLDVQSNLLLRSPVLSVTLP